MTGQPTPLLESPCPCRRSTLWMEVRLNTIINFDVNISIHLIEVFLWIAKRSCLASSWYFTPSFFGRIVYTWSETFHKKSFTDTVGPMATITDSLFSLIIFIYVMVTFLYVFYAFCWRERQDEEEEEKNSLKEAEEAWLQRSLNLIKCQGWGSSWKCDE